MLVHVVDCATLDPGRDPISDIDALEAELAAYTPTLQGDSTLGDLAERPRAVVLNKIDVPEARELADFVREEIEQRYGWPVFEVSTVSREGLRPLTFALWDLVSRYRAAQPEVVPRRPVIRPIPVNESGFTVESDGEGGFEVHGVRPERWVAQTDFTNDEAVGYLGDRLARLGVEDELLKLGARPGCAVTIGDMTFDWEPQTPAGVDQPMSGRGTDIRLEQTDRVGADERKRARKARSRATAVSSHRETVRTARSIVVKIGTTALTTPTGVFDAGRLATLADAIEARMEAGSDVVIVSSGAIAAGIEPLRLSKRPTDLATKQAAASVGQVALINSWSTAFTRYNRTVGQVLLTAHDISMRVQHTNAQRTLDRLRALHAVAIVNENDTVATNEIRFGDNDRLSALVAHLVGADALVLLSDVDGLYDSDPRKGNARFISEVGSPDDLDGVVAGRGSHLGTGGMASKLSAALLASDAGVPVLLAAADDAATALVDASVGTVFAPRAERMSARRFWVRYAAESAGALTLDDGAVRAVVKQRRSLLAAGITAVSGRFHGGDVVDLRAPDESMVARGVVAYDAGELATMLGRSTSDLPAELRRPAVHADDLVAV